MQRELLDTDGRPVIYAGRHADRVAGLPDGRPVLSEWDVTFHRLAGLLEGPGAVVVLDAFSFPFELVTRNWPDVPLVVALLEADAEFLAAVFGPPLFGRVGFFDRLVVGDDGVWRELRRRYGWAEGQRVGVEGDEPEAVAAELYDRLAAEPEAPPELGGEEYEALRYWRERGEALAASAPHRAVCSVRHGLAFNKAMHRAQAAAIESQFAAARGNRDPGVPLEVLEVGAGAGRWAASFDPAGTRFVGADVSEGMVRAARANFPELRFDLMGADLKLPYEDESFDLVFTVTVLHHNPTPAKRALLSEMWRVARPGGRLMFLEDFVAGRQSEAGTVYPMSVLKFVELVLEATGGQVVLEHVESLRYPHDDVSRGGLISLSRLGVPRRW